MKHGSDRNGKQRKRNSKRAGKWRRLVALLMVLFLAAAGIPETVFAESGNVQQISVKMEEIGNTWNAGILQEAGIAPEKELSLPTGGLVYDNREIRPEEIPDDVPIYDISAVFSVQSYALTERRYSYGCLSENQQKLYDGILTGITEFLAGNYKTKDFIETGDDAYIFGINYLNLGLKISDVSAVYCGVRNDYPEYYWLCNGYRYTGDTISVLIGSDYLKASVRMEMETAIQNGMKEYQNAVAGETDEYEILRIVHDKLIDDIEYAYKANGQPEDALWAHSIAGVFGGKHAAVCEGYAKTLQLILNQQGIENIYATGKGNGSAHAWNAVKLGGEWFYVDATWDDPGANYVQNNGILYLYFCIPASVFNKSHTLDASLKSGWPAMSESKNYTFYTRYNCDFTTVTSQDAAKSQLENSGKSVPGQYIHALVSTNTWGYVAGASGVSSAIVAPDGNRVVIIDAAKYKVKNAAVSISVSEELTIDRDLSKTAVLTAELSAASGVCDDVVRWSVSGSCVSIAAGMDGRSVTVTAKRNGTAVITAVAAAGGVKAYCDVTVTGTAEYDNIYLDTAFTTLPEEEDLTIWVNGGNVGPTKDTKYNYKVRSLYTNITASTITTVGTGGKVKTTKGKLVAGVTLSAEEPVLVKGKIVDAEAAKIAKAAVNAKTGLVKITAQKQPGEVYLWVIDTGDEHAVAYAKITVTAAPAKILLNNADYKTADRAVVKKQTLAIGESMQVFLEPLLASKGTELAAGGSYSVTYSKEGEKYVEVVPIAGTEYGYQITPTALDTAKAGKTINVKVTFVCNENNKKATLTITITNPMKDIVFAAGSGLVMQEEDTFTVKYSETQAQSLTLNFTAQPVSESFSTTDKPKIYALSSENSLSVNAKGKVTVVKPTQAAAKLKASLSSDKKSLVVKVPKKLEIGTKTYFALYYNPDCYRVFSVEVTE